jgi:hypothetical protein
MTGHLTEGPTTTLLARIIVMDDDSHKVSL